MVPEGLHAPGSRAFSRKQHQDVSTCDLRAGMWGKRWACAAMGEASACAALRLSGTLRRTSVRRQPLACPLCVGTHQRGGDKLFPPD